MNSAASVKFHFNMPGMHEKLISAVHDIYRGNYSTLFFFLIIIVILLYSFFSSYISSHYSTIDRSISVNSLSLSLSLGLSSFSDCCSSFSLR